MANDIQISLVCFSCTDREVSRWIQSQGYENVEIIRMSEHTAMTELMEYLQTTDSAYICFLEPQHLVFEGWLTGMVSAMEENEVDVEVSDRYFVTEASGSYQVLAHCDPFLGPKYSDEKQRGAELLSDSIFNHRNLYGDLSCLFVRASYAKQALAGFETEDYPRELQKTALLYQLIDNAYVHLNGKNVVAEIISNYSDDAAIREMYCAFLKMIDIPENVVEGIRMNGMVPENQIAQMEKSITLFYTDKGEYYNVEPIAAEAKRRGYAVRFTDNIYEQAEIGIYCQHYCLPENSRFSVILLHDLEQGGDRWPDFWRVEQWDKFDLGILPNEIWRELYRRNKFLPYANPRFGAYMLGYPKCDIAIAEELKERAKAWRKSHPLPYDYTVLYAPSWENDGKEDDAVRALAELPVNLLIKQASWSPKYSDILHNIKEMRDLHLGRYQNVLYMDAQESILVALQLCDLVLSDESNVMSEALMYGKPSLAVTDWMIPDVTPPRPAETSFDFVYRCKKDEIGATVLKIQGGELSNIRLQENRERLFGKMDGMVSSDIMDAIDYFTGNGKKRDFMEKGSVDSMFAYKSLWN